MRARTASVFALLHQQTLTQVHCKPGISIHTHERNGSPMQRQVGKRMLICWSWLRLHSVVSLHVASRYSVSSTAAERNASAML
jgi:hypothetical protein